MQNEEQGICSAPIFSEQRYLPCLDCVAKVTVEKQLMTVVDRALAIAATEPRGPVYLSLPREVIAAPASELESSRPSVATPPAPDAAAVAAAARMLAQAQRPLIVTASAGRDPAAFAALTQFVERFAIPVVQHRPRYLSLPSSHPMNLGFDPAELV